jgi:hypothetical protein
MCCTLEPAVLTNTRIYAAEVMREGTLCHVIGYQNSVETRSYGPNAMLLPFPAEGKVGRENLVNGAAFKDILGSYDEAVERLSPTSKSFSRGFDDDELLGAVAGAASRYEVFESGSYTIALAETPAALGHAVREIPENRRPKVPVRFLIALGKMYPNWPFALCCFEDSMEKPEPLFWWYKPRFPEVLFAPAIDAHDGNPPDMGARVQRDHTLAFASSLSNRPIDPNLQHDISKQVPKEHQWMFDARVCGRQIQEPTENGDFVYPLEMIRDPKVDGWLKPLVAAPPQDRPDRWAHIMGPDTI